MRQLFTLLEWVAPTQITVLITGPTGTGKELVARSLHECCTVRKGPLVVLDCGAADPGLISSELFGHEPGAFTGASNRRAGVFEQARGGTVFIDEVGELPLDLQPKLLRVLESREIRRLGGNQVIPVDVRVIAATNRDLEQMVANGTFRRDLYYRLSQVKIHIPPLELRREDLPILVQAILERFSGSTKVLSVSPEVMEFLQGCSLPGNVRQLKNIIERAAQVARGSEIVLSDLLLSPEELEPVAQPDSTAAVTTAAPTGGTAAVGAPAVGIMRLSWRDSPEEEKSLIIATLEAQGNNLSRTARALGVALNTLKAKMDRLGVPRSTRRDGGRSEGTD